MNSKPNGEWFVQRIQQQNHGTGAPLFGVDWKKFSSLHRLKHFMSVFIFIFLLMKHYANPIVYLVECLYVAIDIVENQNSKSKWKWWNWDSRSEIHWDFTHLTVRREHAVVWNVSTVKPRKFIYLLHPIRFDSPRFDFDFDSVPLISNRIVVVLLFVIVKMDFICVYWYFRLHSFQFTRFFTRIREPRTPFSLQTKKTQPENKPKQYEFDLWWRFTLFCFDSACFLVFDLIYDSIRRPREKKNQTNKLNEV